MNKNYRDILDTIAGQHIPESLNLFPRVAAQLNQRKNFMQTLRARPVLAMILAVFALVLLTGVAYAIGRLNGYIPGVGIVDQSTPIRILAEPVSANQHGISLTVSTVVADSTRTFIAYRVDGIPAGENGIPACLSTPELHLPDGTNLENKSGSGGTAVLRNGDSLYYESQGVYAPIPNGSNDVTFVLDCVLPNGNGVEHLDLPLALVPAPAGYATPAAEIAITPDGVGKKTGLHLEKVLELADSYILIGKFTDGGDLRGPLSTSTSSDSEYLPHIEDANGQPVPFKVREDARPDPDWDVAYYWAYEIPKPVATPVKITVERVNIRKHSTAQIKFETGNQPQAMHKWNLNQHVSLGASEFVVESVTFLGNGYTFNLSSENLPAGVTPDIEILDSAQSPYQFDNNDGMLNAAERKK